MRLPRLRRAPFLGAWAILIGAATACGSIEPQEGAVGGATWEQRWVSADAIEAVVVLTVDDATEAATLRSELREALRATIYRLLDLTSEETDPTAWRHVDWSIWVTQPSAEGSDRWLEPISIRTDQPAAADLDAVADAVEARVNALTSVPGGTYRPMETTRDAVTLLTGQREPADAREEALLAQLPQNDGPLARGERVVAGVVVSGRDDEGAQAPEALAVASQNDPPWVHWSINLVVPSSQSACEGDAFPTDADLPRLRDWAAASETVAATYGWPCGRPLLEERGLLASVSPSLGGSRNCTSSPILVDDGGSALCRAWVEDLPEGAACADFGRGWTEPGPEAPATADCEIPQLTGAAEQACRFDPSCPDCGSGFCQADPDLWRQLHPGQVCDGRVPTRLRFVGGALARSLRVRCALE